MPNFPGFTLTNLGSALQAKAMAGAELTFSKIAMGAGELSGDIEDLTDLIDLRVDDIGIMSIGRDGENVTIRASLLNTGVLAAFTWREIGIYAIDPDDGEILFAASNAGDSADVIPAAVTTIMNYLIDIVVHVGSAEDVTAITLPPTSVFVTQQELSDHNTNEESHPPLVTLVQALRTILGANAANTEAADVTVTGGNISGTDIDDAVIDDSPIGQVTPSAGTFTDLRATNTPATSSSVGNVTHNDLRYGVLRAIDLYISPGTDADTLKVEIVNTWRGQIVQQLDNIGKGETVGFYDLNAAGTALGIASGAFAIAPTDVVSISVSRNGFASDLYIDVVPDNGGLIIVFNQGSSSVDITTLLVSGHYFLARILYDTASWG